MDKVAKGQFSPNHTQQVIVAKQSEIFTGPLPHPEILRQYGELHPDFPERIIKMAEQEQAARLRDMEQENKRKDIELELTKRSADQTDMLLAANRTNTRIGMGLAFLVVVVIMTGTCLCAYWDHPVAAGFIGTGGLAMITAIFVIGSKLQPSGQ